MPAAPHHNRRRDLQDLQNLSRLPILSYLQKQAPPRAPRAKVTTLVPARYPLLAAFSPRRVLKWGWEYLSHRIGPRHAFLTYAESGADQGIYQLEGGDEIRIALAGDWATGTDEAAAIAALIDEFAPHYSIHLGDVYMSAATARSTKTFSVSIIRIMATNPASGRTDRAAASRSTATTKCTRAGLLISTGCSRGSG
jgi:hypothetical protein